MEAFISYNGLPVGSGGGHGLGKLKPIEAYNMTTELLKKFGNNSLPNNIVLEQFTAEKEEYRSSELHWEMRRKFGWFPQREVWRFPDGKQRLWRWNIPHNIKERALNYLDKLEDLPKHEFGPLLMRVSWEFKLIDLNTKKLLPDQYGIPKIDIRIPNNSLRLTLSHKCALSIWVAFPYSDPHNDDFLHYVNQMKKAAPFKFSAKHWRLWTKSKNGTWSPKKIEV